jgi:DNA helicase-2/ATP-dependent DNA helicase PcrA
LATLEALKPWLLGENVGKQKEKRKTIISRLKQHYVEMTRPTHLLCLALKQDSLTPNEMDILKNKKGWRLARVGSSDIEWV